MKAFQGSSIGPTILGLVGTLLMALGTFLPFARLPIVGSINYFRNAQGDGTIILVLALGSAVTLLGRGYLIPLLGSLLSGGILAYDVWQLMSKLQSIKSDLARELSGNLFAGLARGIVEFAQIEVGPFVIGTGAVLLFFASLWGNSVVAGEKTRLPSPASPHCAETTLLNDSKKCPFCAEIIKQEAIVCRYCGRDLTS